MHAVDLVPCLCWVCFSVQSDRAPEELERGEATRDEVCDRLHRVPFSVDRRNSAHLAFFSGSVEDLLEHSGHRQRRRKVEGIVSAFIR